MLLPVEEVIAYPFDEVYSHLMYIKSNSGPNTDTWGTPDKTGL